jgi:hypothetical protein
LALLGVELALAQGDAQMAARRLAASAPDTVSRRTCCQAQMRWPATTPIC